MMFLDASAIVAIPASDADSLAVRLARRQKAYASPLVVCEAILGLARAKRMTRGDAKFAVDAFLFDLPTATVAITAEHGRRAIAAFERYGKGRHRAALDRGDCFADACATDLGVPLFLHRRRFRRNRCRGRLTG